MKKIYGLDLFYTSFLQTVHEENLTLNLKTLDSCHLTRASQRVFTCTLRSIEQILSILYKKATEKTRSRVFYCQLQISKSTSLLQMSVICLTQTSLISVRAHIFFCIQSKTGFGKYKRETSFIMLSTFQTSRNRFVIHT